MTIVTAGFEELVREHERRVLAVCRAVVRDDAAARDVARATFLALWNRLAAQCAPARVGPWLTRVALATALERETTAAASPLERVLARLPAGQRTVFLLVHDAGLTLAEVAEALGVELSAVRAQFARTALKLRPLFTPTDPSPSR